MADVFSRQYWVAGRPGEMGMASMLKFTYFWASTLRGGLPNEVQANAFFLSTGKLSKTTR